MNKLNIRLRLAIMVGIIIFVFSILISLVSAFSISRNIEGAMHVVSSNIDNIETIDIELGPSAFVKDGDITSDMFDYSDTLFIFSETYRNLLFENLLIALAFGIAGFIIACPLSGLLLRPFKRLAEDIAKVNEDNLGVPLPIANQDDEIGQIKQVFNALTKRLETILISQASFTSNVAHELKTPLAVIKMYPATLDEKSTIKDYQEVLAVTDKNIDRMIDLVDDLLTYANNSDVRYKMVRPADIIDRCLSNLEPLINQAGLHVHKDVSYEEQYTSEELLQHIIHNILANATRYNTHGGDIYISYSNKDLSIRDTGIGIPEDKLDRIFEPLYCVDESRSRQLGGSGIGLAIVKRFCDILSIKIEVVSKEGYGTEFTLHF